MIGNFHFFTRSNNVYPLSDSILEKYPHSPKLVQFMSVKQLICHFFTPFSVFMPQKKYLFFFLFYQC